MKYMQATAALAGTFVALGSATPAFAHHDGDHAMPGSEQVAAAQSKADEVTAQQMQKLTDLTTPQKFLAGVKSQVDDMQLRQEAAAARVHPGGPGAMPAPGALLGGLTAGGGPVGVPVGDVLG
ncbi:hypothetical protein ACH4SP_37315 [Streptomyces sp. NPDC021093]|uniref:hypothetical protein n=1 Tax=Streptomyces sp. NPDC021093 TaxID=3365112 RepID=UPI00378F771D